MCVFCDLLSQKSYLYHFGNLIPPTASALSPAAPSWLRSVENHQFLPQTPSLPNTSSNSNHSPSGGDKVTLKPSRLGALSNSRPLLGNGAWKHSRLLTNSDQPPTHPDNENVFQLMNGLTLKDAIGQGRPLDQFCPQDHLNWRGRKKLQLPPNGFNSAPAIRCVKEPAKLKLHMMKRKIDNGPPENSKTVKNCRIYVLVLCLLFSLAFNGVLICLFFL